MTEPTRTPPNLRRRRRIALGAIIGIVVAVTTANSLSRPPIPGPRLPDPNGYDDLERAGSMIHGTWPNKGDLVVLDCTTIVPKLAGSEFFGHERGAFTNAVALRDGAFALADHGTLFLDEVGELPLPLQADLLRVVQEHTFKRVGSNTWSRTEFRLVCATNRDLLHEESQG